MRHLQQAMQLAHCLSVIGPRTGQRPDGWPQWLREELALQAGLLVRLLDTIGVTAPLTSVNEPRSAWTIYETLVQLLARLGLALLARPLDAPLQACCWRLGGIADLYVNGPHERGQENDPGSPVHRSAALQSR